MHTPVYAGYEAIEDDVHAVRKRETSRLWYRDRVSLKPAPATAQLSRSFLNGSTSGRIAYGPAASATTSSPRGIA